MVPNAECEQRAEIYRSLLSWLNAPKADALEQFLNSAAIGAYPYTGQRLVRDPAFRDHLASTAYMPVSQWRSWLATAAARTSNGMAATVITTSTRDSDVVRATSPALRHETLSRACDAIEKAVAELTQDYPRDRSRQIERRRLQIALGLAVVPVSRIYPLSVALGNETAVQLRRLLATPQDLRRVRICASCALLFFDESRSQRARYCNQQDCRRVRDKRRQADYRRGGSDSPAEESSR